MTKEELYKELLTTQPQAQVVVVIEELSELQKELCKYLRGKYDWYNFLEEYVDVLIVMEQMKILFELDDGKILRFKRDKLNRLKDRFKNNCL